MGTLIKKWKNQAKELGLIRYELKIKNAENFDLSKVSEIAFITGELHILHKCINDLKEEMKNEKKKTTK